MKHHTLRQHPDATTPATDTRTVIPAASAGSAVDKAKDATIIESSAQDKTSAKGRSKSVDDIGSDPGITLSNVPQPISPISTPIPRTTKATPKPRRTLRCQPLRRDVGVQCTLIRARRQRREFEVTKTRVINGVTIVERSGRFASWTDLDQGESDDQ